MVTGANRGMGLEFAKALAAKCETVYAGVRDPTAFEAPLPNIEPLRMDLRGLLVVLPSLAVLLVGTAGAEYFLQRLSLVGLLGGLVWFACVAE